MADRGPSGNFFTRWRKRRRAYREARHLLSESRRILRRYSYRIRDDVAQEVQTARGALKEALASKRFSAVRDRLEKLDELVDKHLAFGRKSALREYTESIGIAVLVALLLRAFVVEAFKIPSGSMLPTLEVGDHIFVNKFVYGLRIPWTHIKFDVGRKPRRGEVIVFVYPGDESKDFIKRIVAVGGDTVRVDKNVLLVNGKRVKRYQVTGPCSYTDGEEGEPPETRKCVGWEEEQEGVRYRVIQKVDDFPKDFPTVGSCPAGCVCVPDGCRVPEGHVFVMGDNRDNSHDSRYWGTVPGVNIKGKAMIIWWSSPPAPGWAIGKPRWGRFFLLVHSPPSKS